MKTRKKSRALSTLADPVVVDRRKTTEPVRKIRVAVCATHPIQYQAPLWRMLAKQPDLEVKAIFGTDMSVRGYRDVGFGVAFKWDTPLLEGYAHAFVSTDPRIERVSFREPGFGGILPLMTEFRPDVVLVTAYRSLFHLGVLHAARKVGAKVVMRHEASDVAWARSALKGLARDWIVRRVYARVDRFAAIGIEARKHLLRLGVNENRIGSAPYCVDSDYMRGQIERWRPQREELRARRAMKPGDLALVFSGKLIGRKDPLLIMAALERLPEKVRERFHVIVAGDGELRADVEREGRRVLGERLHMEGFLNQSEIGRAYAAGDCLVLPSPKGTGETWGLVVNEAMQFGLAAIVSDGVGCHPDLVKDGETGFVFASRDADGMAQALRRYAERTDVERMLMRARAETMAAAFSLTAAANGLRRNFRAAMTAAMGRSGTGV
jgi:glycosyltransferase involved in cell wall biosynthesis